MAKARVEMDFSGRYQCILVCLIFSNYLDLHVVIVQDSKGPFL